VEIDDETQQTGLEAHSVGMRVKMILFIGYMVNHVKYDRFVIFGDYILPIYNLSLLPNIASTMLDANSKNEYSVVFVLHYCPWVWAYA
ncbi:hypothetical protein ACJX0J_021375, partial [Zea mays]